MFVLNLFQYLISMFDLNINNWLLIKFNIGAVNKLLFIKICNHLISEFKFQKKNEFIVIDILNSTQPNGFPNIS